MSLFWTSNQERLHRARVRAFIPSRRATAPRDATPLEILRAFVIGLAVASIVLLTALCLAFQHAADAGPNHAHESDRSGAAAPHESAGESSRSGGGR